MKWWWQQGGAWLVLTVLAVCALHLFAFGNEQVADDTYFAAALDHRTLPEYLAFRYHQWSGRIAIEAALVLVIQHPWLWKVLNGLMLLLLCYSVGRTTISTTCMATPAATAHVFALFMLISPAILSESAWWMTGSVNYLWPVAAGLYGLLAFTDGKPHRAGARLGFLLASGFAMHNEQVALVLLPVSLGYLGVRIVQRRWRGWDLAQVGFMTANALVVFTAPGSRHRYLTEQALRSPDFAMLDGLDKVAIGFGLAVRSAIDPHNLLVLALAMIAGVLTWRSPIGRLGKTVILAALVFLAFDYVLASFAPADGSAPHDFYALPPAGGESASSLRVYALHAWSAFVVACLVGASTLAAWRSRGESLVILVTLLLGLGSLVAMGFSPTAYASGWRIHFVCQVGFMLAAARLTQAVQLEFGLHTTNAWRAAIALVAGYRVIVLLCG